MTTALAVSNKSKKRKVKKKEKMKAIKFLSLMLAVLTLLCLIIGCSEDEKRQDGEPSDGTHTITDHNGNTVTVPNTINRIVVCEPYPLASVLSVFFNSADRIVGMSPACMSAAKSGLLGELYPAILNAETAFINGTDLNIEELIRLEPDVVFYSSTSKAMGEQIKSAGLAGIAVSADKWEYNAIDTLENWIILLDELFPSDKARASAVREYSKKIYDMVQGRVSSIPDAERERVFFLFQYSETTLMTSGKRFFGQWWADAVGALNVGAELTENKSVAVNMEQVYKWDPTLIFITNFTTATPGTLYENSVGNYDWSGIDAVKNGRVYKMPLGLYRSYTAGVDTPITLLWLAKYTYPELFEDIDITSETKKYYKEVFGIDLTDDQANKIFAPPSSAGDVSPIG